METLSKIDLIQAIRAIQAKIEANKEYLSRLDTEIGDGDHGFSMAIGLSSYAARLEEIKDRDIGGVLRFGGLELIRTVGGAAGAVFGTFFAGQGAYCDEHLKGREAISLSDFAGMMAEALRQVQLRGKAEVGDKTMVDALSPAVRELARCNAERCSFPNAVRRAALAARIGAESTRDMVGKRGRAKNLGERGRNHIDPGAMSMALIFEAISEHVRSI
jgi:dihydroxyacetone kinase-like protein